MGDPVMLIPDVNPQTKNWTVRITVTEDITVMQCDNGTYLKRYVLSDKEGNEVAASIFGDDIQRIAPRLKLFKVYDVTNARVMYVSPKYQILRNPIHWHIGRDTPFREVQNAAPTFNHIANSLTPFGMINESLKVVDIVGIIVAADKIRYVTRIDGNSHLQRLTLIDAERRPIYLNVWDPITTNERATLTSAIENYSVVLARILRVTMLNGITLATKNSTSLIFNPPIDAASELKAWFDSVRELELKTFKADNSIATAIDLVRRGATKIYTIAEVQKAYEYRDYWVQGSLQIFEEKQNFYYMGCSNCHSKTTGPELMEYTCSMCKNDVVASIRLLVSMWVADETGFLKAVAFEPLADRILQTSSFHLSRLLNLGQSYETETISADFKNKKFMMLLRKTSGKKQDDQRKIILITYFEIPNSDSASSGINSDGKGKAVDQQLSPLKRQMSQISIDPGFTTKRHLMCNADEGTSDGGSNKQLFVDVDKDSSAAHSENEDSA